MSAVSAPSRLAVALALLLAAAPARSRPVAGVTDLDGRAVAPLQPPRAATVLIFTAVDCPISDRYAPEVRRLAAGSVPPVSRLDRLRQCRRVAGRGSRPRGGVRLRSAGGARSRWPARDRARAEVTPEAAVFDAAGRLVYHGRIDDRYVDFGVDRPPPTVHDLADAVTAVFGRRPSGTAVGPGGGLRDRPPPPMMRPTPPLATPRPARARGACRRSPTARGTARQSRGRQPSPAAAATASDAAAPTFNQHIAPLLHAHCAQCHRPGGAGPFSLLTFADASRRAAAARRGDGQRLHAAVESRRPPGRVRRPAAPEPRRDRPLGRWAKAPVEGPGAAPPPPRWPEGWYLGQPDLVVTLPDGYTLPGRAERCVPHLRGAAAGRPAPATCAASSSAPATPASCTTPTSASTAATARAGSTTADPAPGYDGLLARSAEYPDGHFLGWTPGQIAPLVDADLAWRLDPGTDLVVQLHMQPSGKPEAVRPTIGFYFSDQPADPDAVDPAARLAGHRHRARRRPLRRRGSLHAAGGRDAAGGAAARALPCRRRHRHGDVARRRRPAR